MNWAFMLVNHFIRLRCKPGSLRKSVKIVSPLTRSGTMILNVVLCVILEIVTMFLKLTLYRQYASDLPSRQLSSGHDWGLFIMQFFYISYGLSYGWLLYHLSALRQMIIWKNTNHSRQQHTDNMWTQQLLLFLTDKHKAINMLSLAWYCLYCYFG